MAHAAWYSIICDSWVVEVNQSTLMFNLPSNLSTSSASVLGFMLHTNHLDSMSLIIRINGHQVWNWNWSGGSNDPTRFFQEVIEGGVLAPGKNVFSFDSSSGDARLVELSDIVLMWTATV